VIVRGPVGTVWEVSATVIAIGDRDERQFTHRELDAALELIGDDVHCEWVASDSAQARALDDVDGVWLLPGSPYRDDAAAYAAIAHCVETRTPYLGTCAGFQYACVQLMRTAGGDPGATHAESDPEAPNPVVMPLACTLYGERRRVTPVPGTRLAELCGTGSFDGYHMCGFGLAPDAVPRLRRAGVVIGANAPDAGVEAIELPGHPFFLATAFQPQVGAGDGEPLHPLILAFLAAADAHRAGRAAMTAGG
jgi:CTP synthase (UTP-ammonia lyase)